MTESWRKFKELLNDIASRDGITKFTKLAEITGINPNIFTRIKKNEDAEVSDDYFWRINRAFNNRYNIKWWQNQSNHMTMDEYLAAKNNLENDIEVKSNRQEKVIQRAQEIQMAVLGHLVKEPEIIEGMAADDDPRPNLPTWADTLLGILSKQIAENEILHSELKQSISDVREMKKQLAYLIGNIK
ncbi:hypothetical protein IIZ72_01390 [Candidatus Saccharibacteria bacterium]|nr:hypothetical protein [Candidatus Saccharibacteria bacterium]